MRAPGAGSPNPSTFLRLIDLLNERREMLLHSLATGRFEALDALEPPLRRAIAERLKPLPGRAAQLARQAELTYANVWPEIRLLTTWTGGSCGIALGRLRAKLPAATAVMELGYQSTECRGTIALTCPCPQASTRRPRKPPSNLPARSCGPGSPAPNSTL